MKRLALIVAAGLASGLLLALALPPVGWWWLGPVCVAPLFAVVAGQGLLRGFLGGIMVPLSCYAAIVSGILYRVPAETEGSNWVMVGCGFFGMIVAVLACVQSEIKLSSPRRILVLAAIAILLELSLFPILPAHLALTQSNAPGMLLLASVGGIWLPSMVLWAANVAFGEALRTRTRAPALVAFGVLAIVYLVGLVPVQASGPTMRVAAIQTLKPEMEDLAAMNAQAGREGAVLAVWPEFGGIMGAPGGKPDGLRELSAEPGQPAFVTSYPDDHQPMPHNTATLFASGNAAGLYYKQKLFGGEANWHTPGSRAAKAKSGSLPGVGLNICFDSCYPSMVRETGRLDGVDLVALPTTDPQSSGAFIAAMHASFTPFRAAESGVAIVRADGDSYSQIVDSTGHVVASLGPNREGVLVADVPIGRRATLYAVLGDYVPAVAFGWVVFELATALWQKLKRPLKSERPSDLTVTGNA